MPKITTTDSIETDQAEAPDDTIRISKSELESLIAASVAAAVQAKSEGVGMNEAMVKALQDATENQKLIVQNVLEKTGRAESDQVTWVGVSVFNPLGERDHPRPTFVDKNGKYRKTLFCGCDMSDFISTMTREEIEAFNAIDADCDARNGTWTATVRKNGTTEVLDIRLPMASEDTLRGFPSQVAILYELKRGKKMPDINTLLAKMHATAPDPDVFVARLQALLEQASAPVTV
jgi:hypothetical protein